jgi:penicillin V acylase-like amidase (Ntn superfamily)
LAEYWKIENLSFLLKLVEALAAPDFGVSRDIKSKRRRIMRPKPRMLTRLFSQTTYLSILIAGIFLFTQDTAHSCSRILWNTNDNTVISARSMDWAHTFDDWMFVYPREQEMTGGSLNNPVKWTSKYGSVATSISGYAKEHGFDWIKDGSTDGINEKGLAAHLLFLKQTKYPATDNREVVSYMR